MSNSVKSILGLLTIWPLAYIFIFVVSVFSFVSIGDSAGGVGTLENFFPVLMFFHMLTMLLSFGLTIYYLMHALRDASLSSEHRIIWVIVLLTTGLLGMPVYYWVRILGSESNSS